MFRVLFAAALTVLALGMLAMGAPSPSPKSSREVNPIQWEKLSGTWDATWSSGWWKQHRHPETSSAASATTSSIAVTPTSSASPLRISSPSTSQDADAQAYLKSHNDARTQHGAADLTWSVELVAAAQKWADGCKFEHSGGLLGPFGENLAAGTGTFTIAAAMALWVDEASQYDASNPIPSHFTQVVWKGTTQVGCAVSQCDGIFDPKFGKASYYVCEYSAAGNVIGQFPENVQP